MEKLLRTIYKTKALSIRGLSTTASRLNAIHVIGSREVVGFGPNGEPMYEDCVMFPYPSIRFREITPALKAIKEKERGDWKSLTQSEKKCLYRISFCQTLSEANYPTGEAKSILGLALVFVNIAVLFHLFIRILTYQELPDSFNEENQAHQLRRVIDLRMGAITGISSKWDYEEDAWIDPCNIKKKEAKAAAAEEE